MTTTEIAIGQLSEAEHSRQLRRAIVASTVGTIIEAYDFLLYVLVAPLVFAKLYFPESDPRSGYCKRLASTPSALSPARSARRSSGITGPHRAQDDIDRDLAVDGSLDLRRRFRAGLRLDRHLGCDHPDHRSVYSGSRHRRRMGWCHADGDGMGTHQRPSRFHYLLAAMGRSRRIVLRQH